MYIQLAANPYVLMSTNGESFKKLDHKLIYVHSGNVMTFLENGPFQNFIQCTPDQLIMLYNYNRDAINICTLHIKM